MLAHLRVCGRQVIEFCKHYKEDPMNEIEKPLKSANMHDVVQEWYAKFVEVQQETLFELILAANYMDIKPLLDLTCATVASMIKVIARFLLNFSSSRVLFLSCSVCAHRDLLSVKNDGDCNLNDDDDADDYDLDHGDDCAAFPDEERRM